MLSIIPARGGSKGLPGKNIKLLNGLPLIAHSIRVAQACKSITRVVVSTDDESIASIAKEYGAEVPFMRPSVLADDDASAIDVYLHAVKELERLENTSFRDLCVLLPTSPLRNIDDIDSCIRLYRDNDAEVVLSVTETKPLEWHLSRDRKTHSLKTIIDVDKKQAIYNRQALGEPPVILNGSIYVLNISALERTRTYFGNSTFGYVMPSIRSVDIDTEDDFRMAEALGQLE